jgi:hypothetical protein
MRDWHGTNLVSGQTAAARACAALHSQIHFADAAGARDMRAHLIATLLGLQLLLLLCFQSWAQPIPLSELRGYSLESSVDIVDYNTKYHNNYLVGKPFYSAIREMDTIYVSSNGKFFHRYKWSSDVDSKIYDNVSRKSTEGLSYDPSVGFVFMGVPSDQKKRTTYVQRLTFAIKRSSDGFSCHTSMDRIRRAGETQFKKYQDETTYSSIASFTLSNTSCTVRRGNALAR